MSYPNDILSTRAVIKHGRYAVIPPEGLVNNVVPGIEGCKISIIASPKMGAGFVQYIITSGKDGKTTKTFAKEVGVESFIYCIEGEGSVSVGGKNVVFSEGAYAFAPEGVGIDFENNSEKEMKIILYKQRYIPVEGYEARVVFGNVNELDYSIYEGMENVLIKDLLPTDLGFDMNMHILSFKPGGCHPFVETHVQEHGAYVLEGEGAYLLGDVWRMIKKDDFVWFGPFTQQGSYGVGRVNFTYIYSKDCNRDVDI